ncbi:uncharacterized protein LOC111702711 [Eurytemora carolleeae]|uniref:uncharacterized protein LOC111702711 n=1 Tax=Eurytemora carolleeae TaxID=1294199 RepID=UPI000C7928FB|nr:uncharacterized protein LOC111702711 [Eurytemora carolleeae]|eukprot:XP_023330249.1 uncharacterized protein LOC111702711 [Eurytemora affinis]
MFYVVVFSCDASYSVFEDRRKYPVGCKLTCKYEGVPWLGEIVFKAHTLAEAEHYLADNSLSEVPVGESELGQRYNLTPKKKVCSKNDVSTAKASSMMNATLTSSGYVDDEMITDQSFIW